MKEQVLYNLECKDVAKAIFGEEILTDQMCYSLQSVVGGYGKLG